MINRTSTAFRATQERTEAK